MPELSSDSLLLLALIAALGGVDIPNLIFERLGREQNRWTGDGEIGILTPSEAGLESQLQGSLSPLRFSQIMTELAPCIEKKVSESNPNEIWYSIRPPLKEQWIHLIENDQTLAVSALRLTCFIFPRERLWEPR